MTNSSTEGFELPVKAFEKLIFCLEGMSVSGEMASQSSMDYNRTKELMSSDDTKAGVKDL